MKSIFTRTAAAAAVTATFAAGGLAATAAHAEVTVGPVTDEIGVVRIPAGAPIHIGGYWTLSGPDTALGLDQRRGVEIAFDDWNNEVVGHRIRFIAEDGLCNAEGGQTAATKLASDQSMVLVLGPDCSSSAVPSAPILWQAGIPQVATSTTAPALTADDRAEGFGGFVRTVYNDLAQGAADAQYAREELGCETAATIHDGSPYAEQLVRVMETNFREMGGTITSSEAVTPQDVDMRPLLTRVATDEPCVIYFPIFVAAAAQVARQAPDISGLGDTHLLGGSALLAPGFIEAAGRASVGFQFTNVDISPDVMGEAYPQFVEKYRAKFGEAPIQSFHAHAYDGGVLALRAIEAVAVKDDEGNTYIGRKALRDAIFASEFEGISGPIRCQANGDCAQATFAVYEYTDADADTFEVGVNPIKVWP
jgi:branched-chain amino acid transport system substrate-binding protein